MYFIFWILLSILVGVFASSKKRSGVGWFFISLFISPLIGFIILLVIGPSPSTLKKCPKCAEEVKAEAVVCRFCGYEFPQPPPLSIEELKAKKDKLEKKISYEVDQIDRLRLKEELKSVEKEIELKSLTDRPKAEIRLEELRLQFNDLEDGEKKRSIEKEMKALKNQWEL